MGNSESLENDHNHFNHDNLCKRTYRKSKTVGFAFNRTGTFIPQEQYQEVQSSHRYSMIINCAEYENGKTKERNIKRAKTESDRLEKFFQEDCKFLKSRRVDNPDIKTLKREFGDFKTIFMNHKKRGEHAFFVMYYIGYGHIGQNRQIKGRLPCGKKLSFNSLQKQLDGLDNVAFLNIIDHVRISRTKPNYQQFIDFCNKDTDHIILYNPSGEPEKEEGSLADNFIKKYREVGHETKVKEIIHNMPELEKFYVTISGKNDIHLKQTIEEKFVEQGFTPQMVDHSEIINDHQFIEILSKLPKMNQMQHWAHIYATASDGLSLKTLLKKTENYEPCILLVKTMDGAIFGAYINDDIHRDLNWYSNGELFLFSFKDNKNEIKVFPTTQKNDTHLHSDSNGIMLGSDPGPGLYLASDLLSGTSVKCKTFDNDVLSTEEKFQIKWVEVWNPTH